MNEMNEIIPCKECLVRIPCSTKLIKDGTLIIEHVDSCPTAKKFIAGGRGRDDYHGRSLYSLHTYVGIYELCDFFNINERDFVWHENELMSNSRKRKL